MMVKITYRIKNHSFPTQSVGTRENTPLPPLNRGEFQLVPTLCVGTQHLTLSLALIGKKH
jgi:hypothetical protein